MKSIPRKFGCNIVTIRVIRSNEFRRDRLLRFADHLKGLDVRGENERSRREHIHKAFRAHYKAQQSNHEEIVYPRTPNMIMKPSQNCIKKGKF